jgi:hypothetical protein
MVVIDVVVIQHPLCHIALQDPSRMIRIRIVHGAAGNDGLHQDGSNVIVIVIHSVEHSGTCRSFTLSSEWILTVSYL